MCGRQLCRKTWSDELVTASIRGPSESKYRQICTTPNNRLDAADYVLVVRLWQAP
jgi:hypothetical protein